MSDEHAKISAAVHDDGAIEIDLGGALDRGCCGCEAVAIHQGLAELGIHLDLIQVGCRLPISERIKAKLTGCCKWKVANPTKSQEEYAETRLVK